MISAEKLGAILHQRRVNLRLTLRDIKEACGVSVSHLGRIENGERSPSAETLVKLAKPLGYEVEELFRLVGYLPEKKE